MSHATAIREWALQWPHGPIAAEALDAADRAGLGMGHWVGRHSMEIWRTYWLIVAEAMDTGDWK